VTVSSEAAGSSFEVHLASLVDFAWELEGQLEALRLPVDKLSALRGNALPLGGFDEAYALGEQHQLAAQQISGLLDTARQAVAFAAGVTRAVTTGYEAQDEQAAAAYQSIGTARATADILAPPGVVAPPGTVVPASPSAPAGTIYYSAQYPAAESGG
jgi:hypothetical protein